MLILTRYLNHGDRSVICIGPDIEITLVHVQGDQVHLAVELPDAVAVSLHDRSSSLAPPAAVNTRSAKTRTALARSSLAHAATKG